MNAPTKSVLVALTGGSGAGKTWLASRLLRECGDEAMCLSLDDFYRDLSHLKLSARQTVNFDHPSAIDWPLFFSVVRTLKCGLNAAVPRYDFGLHTRLPDREWRGPRSFIIIEGLWLLWSCQLREIFDLRLYLDCPESLRWRRRLARDMNERGRTASAVDEQFWKNVAPMHECFVEAQRAWADQVIEPPIDEAHVNHLVATIQGLHPKQAQAHWKPTGFGGAPPRETTFTPL